MPIDVLLVLQAIFLVTATMVGNSLLPDIFQATCLMVTAREATFNPLQAPRKGDAL